MPLSALVAGTLAAGIALAAGPGIETAAASCPHARAHPHEVSLGKLREAITCLINHERSQHERHRLDPNRKLERAAQRHDDTMLEQDCFKHQCIDEPNLNHRVRQTGYTKGENAWAFAEDLGYDNTPREMIKRWLNTKFDRHNLLDRDFRDVGVGVGWGVPKATLDDSKFATYTIVSGWRRP